MQGRKGVYQEPEVGSKKRQEVTVGNESRLASMFQKQQTATEALKQSTDDLNKAHRVTKH